MLTEKKMISKELFDVLACPDDNAHLKYTSDGKGLVCVKCKAIYPIKEGIPILIPKNRK